MSFNFKRRRTKTDATFISKKQSKIQKILAAGILIVGLPFGVKYAEANQSESFQTIHHVYLNDEYIGKIADEEKLEQLKEEKIEVATEEFDGFSLAIEEGLSIVPERVFSVKTDDEKVLTQLEKELSVETESVGIQVNDEIALHVKDDENYEEVVNTFILQWVTEEELTAYEKAQELDSLPELSEGEKRIAKMIFSAEIEPIAEKVKPEEILTVTEAVEVLNKGSINHQKYAVQSGDVLGKIANQHNMATQELIDINEGLTEDTVLQIDDELNVTYAKPYIELEVHYETKEKIKTSHDKVTKKDENMDKGKKKVTQEGKDGEKVVTEYIREKNGKVLGKSTLDEQVISEPVDEITVVGTKVTPSKGEGIFRWPTVGGYVSSTMGMRWGRMHQGIDIARPSNRSILAADNGVVVTAGHTGGYGNRIIIDHNNGYRTLYAHLSSINVRPGQTVSAGSKIGVMGATGNSTGVHLHFEVTKNGSLINPLSVLK